MTKAIVVTETDIGAVVGRLIERADDELFSTEQKDLEKFWFFKWEEGSVAWNVYRFNRDLDLYKLQCRRWEEHHYGRVCVVERVRDKYLMPKINGFVEELKKRVGE